MHASVVRAVAGMTVASVLLLTGPAAGQEAQGDELSAFSQTTDRLSTEERDALVAGPTAHLEAGDLSAGVVAFEILLTETIATYGEDSVRVADLISAFAVQLDVNDYSAASLPFFYRAKEAYVRAFGPEHPEVAVAWTDIGIMLLKVDRKANRQAAIGALKQAYEIRRAQLGTDNAETAFSLLYIAEAYVEPGKAGEPPARSPPDDVDSALRYYRQAAATYPPNPRGRDEDRATIWRQGMRMLIANGRPAEAVNFYTPAITSLDQDFMTAGLLYEELLKAGYTKEAAAVRRRYDREGYYWPEPEPAAAD